MATSLTSHLAFDAWPARVRWPAHAGARGAAERVLAYHGFRPSPPAASAWRWDLDGTPVRVPDAATVVGTERESRVTARTLGDVVYVEGPGGALAVRREERVVEGGFTVPAGDGAETDGGGAGVYGLLTLALLVLLEREGACALHAAALVAPGGAGVVLVGASDSGKSTMTMHLARAGWPFLSDDSLLLRAGADGGVDAAPFRRSFGLDPDAEAIFPELSRARERQLTDAHKLLVDAERLFPGGRAERVRPALLLFPTVTDAGTSRAVALRPADAFVRLLAQGSFLHPDAARAGAARLAALARQCRAYAFLSGRDVHRDGERLAHHLRALLPDPHDPAHAHVHA